MGFLRSLRDVKKFALRYEFKRGFEGVYFFARLHVYVQVPVLLKYQIVRTTQKSVYGNFSIK